MDQEFGILIVDDDNSSLESLCRSLIRLKYKVYQCCNPNAAKSMIRTHKIGMLLTDIMMPGKNGFQLTRELSEIYPELSIYGYTGFYREGFEFQAESSGMKRILSKPLDLRELNRIIKREKLARALKC